MESKNQKLLESFSEYCNQNPEMRFWQSLRNWAGVNFIGVGHEDDDYIDTFFSNNQDGR